MKKTIFVILALLTVSSAFAAETIANPSATTTTPAPSSAAAATATLVTPAPAPSAAAPTTTTATAIPSPATVTTANAPDAATTNSDDDASAPHLDQTISLKAGGKVLIYNGGAKVDVLDAKGQLTQTSCFDGCAIPLQRAVDFLNTLKQAVQKGDKQIISNMIAYPLPVHGTKLQINEANDFVSHYAQIFTPNVIKAIEAQEPYTLFANDQGVMVGNGQVWFTLVIDGQQDTEGTVFITAVNA